MRFFICLFIFFLYFLDFPGFTDANGLDVAGAEIVAIVAFGESNSDIAANEVEGAAIDAASRHTIKLRFMKEGFKNETVYVVWRLTQKDEPKKIR